MSRKKNSEKQNSNSRKKIITNEMNSKKEE